MQTQWAFRSATLPNVRTPYMMIRLPFRFMYGPKGKRIFTLDTSRIKDFLDVSDECEGRLAKVFSPPDHVMRKCLPKKRIDYPVLAVEYGRLPASGKCKDMADIARRFAVSRAWITKVTKKGSPSLAESRTGKHTTLI